MQIDMAESSLDVGLDRGPEAVRIGAADDRFGNRLLADGLHCLLEVERQGKLLADLAR